MAGRRILRDSELQAGDVSVRLSSPSPSRVGPGLGVRLGVQQLRISVTGTVTAQANSGWQLTESSSPGPGGEAAAGSAAEVRQAAEPLYRDGALFIEPRASPRAFWLPALPAPPPPRRLRGACSAGCGRRRPPTLVSEDLLGRARQRRGHGQTLPPRPRRRRLSPRLTMAQAAQAVQARRTGTLTSTHWQRGPSLRRTAAGPHWHK